MINTPDTGMIHWANTWVILWMHVDMLLEMAASNIMWMCVDAMDHPHQVLNWLFMLSKYSILKINPQNIKFQLTE